MAITVKHKFVSAIPDAGDPTIVQPSNWNDDHDLVGTIPVANGGTGASTLTGYVKGNGTSTMTASSTIPNTDITGLGTASTKDAGSANGVATLDAGGKVPVSELPAAVLGALSYQGTWNASTNSPTLTSSVGTKGYYYVVSVAGSTNLNGITDWLVGDWAVFNGSVWQKVDNTETVTSVNGQVGAVVLTASDVGAQPAGTYVTSVSATSPVASSGGTTPTISMPAANSTTNGYLTSTDWNTFNTISTGGVVGPASATDNAIARYDGTTGKLIQNSTVTLDDNGNIINANSIGLDTTPATVPSTVGTMSWDDGDGVPSVLLKGGNVTLQVGTQEYARVYNDSGTTLTKGQVVYISGAQGNRVAVKLAKADVEATSFGTIGLVAETMTSGAEGFIIVSGALYKLNTTGLTAGATVYLSPTTAGALTTTKPQAPQQLVVLGWVERVDNIVGSIYVKVDNGYELDELHDVQVTSPQSGNLLIYDASTTPIGVWKNAFITAGTAISVTNGAGSISIANTGVTSAVAGTGISVSGATGAVTITNSAPDQTVAISSGTGISVTGTYPNFTVTNTSPSSGGTVTSVTGTAPVVSSGGNTPAISMAAATGSVNGYLTSTDWTTFNSKAPAVTYTTNYVPYGQGTTTPALSANFTYDPSLLTLTAPQMSASNGIVCNANTIAANFTIPTNYNAMSAGPITVNTGVTVTVPTGSTWVVV